MTSPKKSLVFLNAASNYARFGMAMLCTVLLTPVVVQTLGPDDYGLWTLVLCIAGYLELFDFGLTAGAMRFIARIGDDQESRKKRLVNTLIGASLALTPLVALTAVGLSLGVGSTESQRATLWPTLVALMAIRAAVMLPLGVLMGVLFGEHRIWLVNSLRTASVAIFSLAAYFVLSRGFGVLALGVVYALVYSLEYLVYGVVAVKQTSWLKIDLRLFDRGLLKEVLGFSVSSFTANASNVVLMRTDPFIVSGFLSLGAVAFYAIPLRITEQLFTLSKQLINVFSPLYAQLHGSGRLDSVRAAYLTCSRLSLGMMIGVVIPAIGFASDALRFWIGEEFVASSSVLVVLLAAAILRTLQESSANALAMTGRHYFIARVSIASAVSNVVLSTIGVIVFGLVGVAVATLVSVAIFGALLTTIVACREYRISTSQFSRGVLLPVVIPTLAQVGVIWLLYVACPPNGLLTLLMCGAVAFATYLAFYLTFSLCSSERAVVRHWVGQISRRFPLRRTSREIGVVESPFSERSTVVARQESCS